MHKGQPAPTRRDAGATSRGSSNLLTSARPDEHGESGTRLP